MTDIHDIHDLAVRTDNMLADLFDQRSKLRQRVQSSTDWLHRLAGHRRNHNGLFIDSIDGFDPSTLALHRQRDWADEVATITAARASIAELDARIDACNLVWEVHGRWSRFFLVTNTNGHIHRTMDCSTCHLTTEFRWLPTLSGLTETEAVAGHGEILCSVCFPSAPVAWTTGTSKASQQAKAERAAAKAERAAAKLAKALMPDGSDLDVVIDPVGRNGRPRVETFTTLTSAKTWLTDAASWGPEHPSFPAHAVEIVAAAVAAKLGTTVEVEVDAAKKRAAKRR